MDRRQRKTREAIFAAFVELLHKKDFTQITVGEIIALADVGRATFYAHFETKEFLLSELCEELFCHLFDSINQNPPDHTHIFRCNAPNSVFLHLFQHLEKNDNNIRKLLSGQNNELFLQCFKKHLKRLIESQMHLFENRRSDRLPDSFWIHHISTAFIGTLEWWLDTGAAETAETITEYFFLAVS